MDYKHEQYAIRLNTRKTASNSVITFVTSKKGKALAGVIDVIELIWKRYCDMEDEPVTVTSFVNFVIEEEIPIPVMHLKVLPVINIMSS